MSIIQSTKFWFDKNKPNTQLGGVCCCCSEGAGTEIHNWPVLKSNGLAINFSLELIIPVTIPVVANFPYITSREIKSKIHPRQSKVSALVILKIKTDN